MSISYAGYRTGFPFPIYEKNELGLPFEEWDGSTYYYFLSGAPPFPSRSTASPSGSGSTPVTVIGPRTDYPIGFTPSEYAELIWRCRTPRISFNLDFYAYTYGKRDIGHGDWESNEAIRALDVSLANQRMVDRPLFGAPDSEARLISYYPMYSSIGGNGALGFDNDSNVFDVTDWNESKRYFSSSGDTSIFTDDRSDDYYGANFLSIAYPYQYNDPTFNPYYVGEFPSYAGFGVIKSGGLIYPRILGVSFAGVGYGYSTALEFHARRYLEQFPDDGIFYAPEEGEVDCIFFGKPLTLYSHTRSSWLRNNALAAPYWDLEHNYYFNLSGNIEFAPYDYWPYNGKWNPADGTPT